MLAALAFVLQTTPATIPGAWEAGCTPDDLRLLSAAARDRLQGGDSALNARNPLAANKPSMRTRNYNGWLQVDPDEDGSRLTLYVATVHGDAPDPEVMGTLDAIRRLVEADV